MKRFFRLFFVMIFVVFLFGCKENNDSTKENLYEKELDAYMESVIPSLMTKGFEIPLEFDYSDGKYALLEWTSLSENVVSISKKGKVLYLSSLFDTEASIKCDINIDGDLAGMCTYTFNVKGDMTEKEYVDTFNELYIPDSVYKDIKLESVENQIFKSRNVEGSVTYKSSNESIFGSDGKYNNTGKENTSVTLSYTILINGFTINGSKEIVVEGKNDELLVENAATWLEDTWKVNTIKGDLEFPKTDNVGKVDMVWESNNKTIVDDSGKFVRWVVDTEIVFNVTISINEYKVVKELKMMTISTDEAIKYIMDMMHEDEYFQSYFYTYIVSGGHANIDYGCLNFYTLDLDESKLVKREYQNGTTTNGTNTYNTNTLESKFTLKLIPRNLTYKRPLDVKSSTEFITVHDTGDNSFNAASWANEVTTSSRQVSWHFTVDDKEIYQHVPLDEVAYHAGDGGSVFSLKDTGVKYTVANPKIEVGEDGVYYINGIKSKIAAPYDSTYKAYTSITPAGIYTEMGENGNYYMNNTYYNSTYQKISNCGGNYYSIGIESCVHDGVEYSKVQKRLANLIAHLLNLYDLDPSRVLLHRSFSGKYCPQSMLRAYEKDEPSQFNLTYFYKMIDIEYFIVFYV